MADKQETSKRIEENKTDQYNNDRHNANARAAADSEPTIPRINTDNL